MLPNYLKKLASNIFQLIIAHTYGSLKDNKRHMFQLRRQNCDLTVLLIVNVLCRMSGTFTFDWVHKLSVSPLALLTSTLFIDCVHESLRTYH